MFILVAGTQPIVSRLSMMYRVQVLQSKMFKENKTRHVAVIVLFIL